MRAIKKGIILFMASIVLAACGGEGFNSIGLNSDNFSSGNGSSGGGVELGQDINAKLVELDLELEEAEKTILEAEKDILSYDIVAQSGGSESSKLSEKGLDNAIERALNKAVLAVTKANDKLKDVRARVQEKIFSLDPLNPLHLPLLIKAREIFDFLDRAENGLRSLRGRLVQRINDLIARIEKRISEMDPSKPATWAVMILWQKLKSPIVSERNKLQAIQI
jgi:hypothetical protein